MSIGKLALAAMTLFGLAVGVNEAIRLAGGLALIIIAQILLFGGAMAMLIMVARRDRAEQAETDGEAEGSAAPPAASPAGPTSSGRTHHDRPRDDQPGARSRRAAAASQAANSRTGERPTAVRAVSTK